MTDIHPNWQTTESDAPGEQSLPIHIVEKPKSEEIPPSQKPPPRVRRLSRQPAAVAGMLLAISVGLTFFFGMDSGETPTVIRITSDGFSPQTITVTPGSDLTWTNESARSHVLQSDTLCTQDRECFVTPAIAPGETAHLTITDAFAPGTYSVYSISAQGMEGSITVLAAQPGKRPTAKTAIGQNLAQAAPFTGGGTGSAPASSAPASSAASFMSAPSGGIPVDPSPTAGNEFVDLTSLLSAGNLPPLDDDVDDFSALNPFGSGAASSANTSAPRPSAALPVNPYRVNATTAHPFDEQGNPVAPGSGSSSSKSVLHGGAPRPIAQPSTGPGLWVTILGTFGLLFFATHRALRRPTN
ncbi:MAG TPA: hypothetical protein DEB30_00930 [Candidatus Peribacter riflensis]|uniref:EfeO-type cupredoxin-like domain-containing protein n=1 Tax=Candidatus Peribacter riflensis TaxID=1735162 RepID=A0A0S1SRE1_9BACT|nr:MAG: hypothetical protein PeribacterA2_0348 [Candidatus Peribacter riflensis]OGJ78309.1 MAG: hypothetical protein A2398_05505 [Candidatus Peribacteria bacterium RIFOXYB1_FULL_57_12]OGJ82371.1 MAG: hypothetical protein A2412_03605 [Candidatus Peribacteria bacterium RIFOXYC1_FULL_58_8]ALM10841.1 MAG: hypothetical protein PeribacterB2_0348 [Candidatus Peribacter riflensis]ALM11943.1 MAG: hypothetical protein PeribacterC2_0347 [Candidatus Peribacter riflensis]